MDVEGFGDCEGEIGAVVKWAVVNGLLLMHYTDPVGPNYRLRVAKVGFRAAKRDY